MVLMTVVMRTRTEPVDSYLQSFQWNRVKYRADKSIAENLAALQRVHSPSPPPAPAC